MRSGSGIAICPLLTAGELIGEHGPHDGVGQMVVGIVSGEKGVEVLERMSDMLLYGDLGVVPVVEVLTVLFSAPRAPPALPQTWR